MLLEISGETTPERMKRWSQSKNNTQLWMWLVMEARSDNGLASTLGSVANPRLGKCAPSPPAGAEHCSGRPNPRGPGHLLCGSLSALGLSFPSLSWREAGCWYLPEVEPHLARLHFPFLWRRDPPPRWEESSASSPEARVEGGVSRAREF